MAFVVVTDRRQIAAAIRRMTEQLAVGAEEIVRTVGYPTGSVRDAALIWRPGDHLWAYIRDDYVPNRYWCAFGTDVGQPGKSLNISVEINPPFEGVNRQVRGQIVRDEDDGSEYLAHRGGLGGGRGGDVKIADFWRWFEKPRLETVSWREGGNTATLHIMGPIGTPLLVDQIHHFVSEAERLRGLARREQLAPSLRTTTGLPD